MEQQKSPLLRALLLSHHRVDYLGIDGRWALADDVRTLARTRDPSFMEMIEKIRELKKLVEDEQNQDITERAA